MKQNQKTLLIKNIGTLVTMNKSHQVLHQASLLIQGNRVREINGKRHQADQVIDAAGKILLPGLINTHHHLFQSFLRHVPEMQNQRIEKWIALVCSLTKKMDIEAHYFAALGNMIELLYSGCTTTTDMLYIFPRNQDHQELFQASISAAQDCGIRFHPFRGSMSIGKKQGGIFDNDVVETEPEIAARTASIIERFHQPEPDAMVKVGIAPCTIFTSSEQDYRIAADLAQRYQVNLQTHLSESVYEQECIQTRYHQTPLAFLQATGWTQKGVSFAHCIEVSETDISLLKKYHASVCHCPISNARSPIGQKGIAPITEMMNKKVNVAIGVDGSAGNDSSNMLEEMRWARTLQGIRPESTYLDPMKVLEMGTINGARALQWDKTIGSIEEDKCADIAIFDIKDSVSHLGARDEVGSLISCQAKKADTVIVNGKIVIHEGKLVNLDEKRVVSQAWQKWSHIFINN